MGGPHISPTFAQHVDAGGLRQLRDLAPVTSQKHRSVKVKLFCSRPTDKITRPSKRIPANPSCTRQFAGSSASKSKGMSAQTHSSHSPWRCHCHGHPLLQGPGPPWKVIVATSSKQLDAKKMSVKIFVCLFIFSWDLWVNLDLQWFTVDEFSYCMLKFISVLAFLVFCFAWCSPLFISVGPSGSLLSPGTPSCGPFKPGLNLPSVIGTWAISRAKVDDPTWKLIMELPFFRMFFGGLSAVGSPVAARAGHHTTMHGKRLNGKWSYYELYVQPQEEAKRVALGCRCPWTCYCQEPPPCSWGREIPFQVSSKGQQISRLRVRCPMMSMDCSWPAV